MPFNGYDSLKRSKSQRPNKIIFSVDDNDLIIKFYETNKLFATNLIKDFRELTALDVFKLYDYQTGRHFDDGIFEIWDYYHLPFGYMKKIFKETDRDKKL